MNYLRLRRAVIAVLFVLLPGVAGLMKVMGQGSAPAGAINGMYSIAEGQQVYFSQGNLQYIGSAGNGDENNTGAYWKFADHQWDYLGDNGQGSDSKTVDRDLFGWGTSGYNHGANCYQPWSTSTSYGDYYVYGSDTYNLYDQTGQADWGYNAISNGGNTENGGWRTLTRNEWNYLFNTRSTSSGIRYAKATVNSVNGVILLPDDWSVDYYMLNSTNTSGASFGSNNITSSQWATLEQYGAVFLPAAGRRVGTSVDYVGSYGYYWSASFNDSYEAYYVLFHDGYLDASYYYNRYYGRSVRLVCPVENYSIHAIPDPAEGGAVSGAGAYAEGAECTLTATASAGYTFVNWTENGEVVSTDPTYLFTVTGDRELVANFVSAGSNVTDGVLNGLFSVGENTTVRFSQGNLQYIGSAGNGDENNNGAYWKFADHQWDYLGDNGQGSDSKTVDRDLFGWGTSGWNNGNVYYQPWSIDYVYDASTGYGYGPTDGSNYEYDLTGAYANADWGSNAISNGGNQENSGWRTLTQPEWDYVFNTRTMVNGGPRYTVGRRVEGVKGVIVYPDNYAGSAVSSDLTSEGWAEYEAAGCVFLPAAGYRSGTSVRDVGSLGGYWSASYYNSYYAYNVYFLGSYLGTDYGDSRGYGHSVRLVRPAQNCSFTINATPNPAEGGAVSGAGAYAEGAECTLTATASAGYTFVNWTENGEVVSTDPTYLFTVTGDRELVANFVSAGSNVTEGVLNGVFSVGDNSTVQFSQGNLQYKASTNTWRFAESQWDYVGTQTPGWGDPGGAVPQSDNSNISQNYNGWIDLFGWGTSGWNNGNVYYQPWSTDYVDDWTTGYGYGPTDGSNYEYDLTGAYANADWGSNAIINGGNQENSGWRTLTQPEWDYVFNTRTMVNGGPRYTLGSRVEGVLGVVVYPDNYAGSAVSSDLTSEGWAEYEAAGCVFLPAAGYRNGTSVDGVGSYGNFWSASYNDSYNAYGVFFYGSSLYASSYGDRYYGLSVRLVRSAQNYSFTINATPNPAEGGAVSGAGAYEEGAECTLTATASAGYIFVNWTENGEVVSTDPTYLFTVTGDRTLVANFVSAGSNVTDGVLNGVFSVGDNSTVQFSQGNLQYKASTNTWRFAESQWDYVGTQTPGWGGPGGTVPQSDNSNISQNYNGWIDLFGWGTSGWNNGNVYYQPWSTDYDVDDYNQGYGYGPTDGTNYEYDLTGAYANADWGSNAISNGGNQENSGWRTLTQPEWYYVFNTRTMVNGGPRYTVGKRVEGVLGVVVYPDNYAGSAVSSDLTADGWAEYEAAGCAFLPAAGFRYGTSVNNVGSEGYYCSASCYDTEFAWYVNFSDSYLNTDFFNDRYGGFSVRLVRSAQNYSFTINATPNPAEGGAVSGAGAYAEGTECTLTATASAGYTFVNWTENGEVVSTDPTYLFTVTGDRELVANFSAAVDAVQDIHLSEGWNWFSSYITYDENSFGYMTEAIGDMVTTSVIKSQTEFTSLDVSGWSGTLDDLQNQNMYMILVGGDIDISLNGALVNPAAVPITLSSGWNWMVYLPNVTMSLEQGLANLEPVDGDMIKSQSGFSSYNSDEGGWVGTLNLLKPGEGYAYLNNGMEDKTLVYPNSSKGAVAENTEKRHFSYNCHRFMGNMTLMMTLDASEFDLGKGSHEIAAFVGDDCRGSARLQEVNGQYIAFVTVGGEDGEEVTFRLFDVKGGEVYPELAQEKLRYATDAVYGSLKEPFKLHFRGAGLDETEAMLRVSPNPVYAHGEVRLGLPTAEKVRVEIYSALGIKVMSKETSDGRIVLSPAVVPGTYIMKVVSASGAGHYCKLIVE